MFLVIWPNCVAAQETFAWLASKPRFWCPSMQIIYKDFANGSHPSPFPPRFARFRGRSQTTLTRFWFFLTTYPPVLTFSMGWTLTKSHPSPFPPGFARFSMRGCPLSKYISIFLLFLTPLSLMSTLFLYLSISTFLSIFDPSTPKKFWRTLWLAPELCAVNVWSCHK